MFPSYRLSPLAFEILLRQKPIPSSCRVVSQRRSGGRTTHVRLWVKTCHTLIVRVCVFSLTMSVSLKRALTVSTDNAEMKIPQKTAEGFQCHLFWEKNIMVSILGPFVCIFVIQVVLKHFQRMKRVLTARRNSILCPAFETPRVPLK